MEHEIQFVAITFDDASVSVMSFVLDPRLPDGTELPGYDPETGRREATDEAIRHEIDKSAWGERTVVGWRRIERRDVPADRTFRGAWRDHDGKLAVDMAAAAEIHRGRLREARAPLLAELDVAYQRADETGDKKEKTRVAGLKQKLRDAPADPRVAAAKTPAELVALTIDILAG